MVRELQGFVPTRAKGLASRNVEFFERFTKAAYSGRKLDRADVMPTSRHIVSVTTCRCRPSCRPTAGRGPAGRVESREMRVKKLVPAALK